MSRIMYGYVCSLVFVLMDLPIAFGMFMARNKMVKGLSLEATLTEQIITRAERKSYIDNVHET